MYPLKHKIILGILLFIALFIFLYFLFVGFSLLGSNSSYIFEVMPYLFLLSSLWIVLSPVVFGGNKHWLVFFIYSTIISIISLGTGRYIYNLQSLILLGVCISVHIFSKKKLTRLKEKVSAINKIEESANILKAEQLKAERFNNALSERLKRYGNLREIGESFSAKLSLEEIYRLAVDTAYNMIQDCDIALLFIVDEPNQQLLLCASKSGDELPRIKSKNGDIFDQWVFKERQSLNVEDVDKDFRFDYKPLYGERPFKSLISVPLISHSRITGALRLNSRNKGAYTFDDLRLLDFISDLVSSAINNARLYKTTEDLSTKDSLTGFYIHRYLKERLKQEAERAHIGNLPLSMIMIDIDHFKDYNDRHGHSAGDKVLLEISNIIRNNIKNGYIIARYGGEEFVILMPNSGKDKARLLAERIREDIAAHQFILRRRETKVTISAGIASYSKDIKDGEELLKKADFCLYKAKKEGRNKICVV